MAGKYDTKIENFVSTFHKEHGYPPTVRDIKGAVGAGSTCTIWHAVRRLVGLGKLQLRGTEKKQHIYPWNYR